MPVKCVNNLILFHEYLMVKLIRANYCLLTFEQQNQIIIDIEWTQWDPQPYQMDYTDLLNKIIKENM